MSFPFDAVASLTQQFRDLREPSVSLPNIVPVGLVADYSRRASTEPIECRNLAAWREPGVALNRPFFQLHAETRPLVVDLLYISCSTGTFTFTFGIADFQLQPPTGAQASLPLGGIAPTGLLDAGVTAVGFAGQVSVTISPTPQNIPSGSELRALVPPGFTMFGGLTPSGVGQPMDFGILWREIVT